MIPPLLRRLWHAPAPWGMRYSLAERVDRAWRLRVVWWLIALIPRPVKYHVIIEAAVKRNLGDPGERTANEMLHLLGGPERSWTR